ncbi:hypothetical protein [Streptomyces sp. NPDC096311]
MPSPLVAEEDLRADFTTASHQLAGALQQLLVDLVEPTLRSTRRQVR